MIFSSGADLATSDRDFVQRAGLLVDELDMGGQLVDEMLAGVRREVGNEHLEEARSAANSDVAIELIHRFAVIEGNIDSTDRNGIGRVSSVSFPRFGGVLAREARRHKVDEADIVRAMERTIHASYLATLLAVPSVARTPRIKDTEAVWKRFIPGAYVVPEAFINEVFRIPAFEAFWERALERWGMPKADKQLSKVGSDFGVSLGGLCGVGIALACSERESSDATISS